jgi:steroid delta-isomerase-like uncharacterized protein
MTKQNNVAALARRFFELMDSHDFAAVESHVSPSCVSQVGSDTMDRAGWLAQGKGFYQGFPDGHFHFDHEVVTDDTAVFMGTWSGTHKAPFMGIPATGRSVSIPLIVATQIEDGKVVRHWGQFDTASLVQQITAK